MSGSVHGLRGAKTAAVSSSARTSDGCLGREEQAAPQLLPGIPDEITLDLVSPKLPWSTFYVLSSVSQAWKRAVRSGQVYDARVRADATDTVAVIDHIEIDRITKLRSLALYSGTDKLLHRLPPIPNVPFGIPRFSQSIALDGKIYVIGGLREYPDSSDDNFKSGQTTSLDDVYVLDLARQRPWEQRKSMGCARMLFGLGAVGGKIYVLGGLSIFSGPAVTVSEVYDPLYNTWHPIESMINWRHSAQVWTVGEELFIHGGCLNCTSDLTESESDDDDDDFSSLADVLEIYHPGKNAWSKATPLHRNSGVNFMDTMFIHQGRLYSVTWSYIEVYDMDKKSWTSRHSYSPGGSSSALLADNVLQVGQGWDPDGEPYVGSGQEFAHLNSLNSMSNAIVSGNELVTLVFSFGYRGHRAQALLSSIGFGTQDETIQWKKVENPFQLELNATMCSFQL